LALSAFLWYIPDLQGLDGVLYQLIQQTREVKTLYRRHR
jgi:hypothetical protein